MDDFTKQTMMESERDSYRMETARLKQENEKLRKIIDAHVKANESLGKMVKGWKEFGELHIRNEVLEQAVKDIAKLMYWDFDEEAWKPEDSDPNWYGLDEICEIDGILRRANP